MNTASVSMDWWYEQNTTASNDTIIDGTEFGRFSNDDNGESLHLFMAPIVLPKEYKKPSKWLQKVIKRRGKR